MTSDDSADNPDQSLEAFLAASPADVAAVAPPSMIYSVSGTRRGAALAGKMKQGLEYMEWSRQRMMECLDLIFAHGVRHIIMPVITPSQFREATPSYREHLWAWLDHGLAGPQAVSDYAARDWRVRLPFYQALPRLSQAGERLAQETAAESDMNLWTFVAPQHNFLWEQALARLAQNPPVHAAPDAIRLLFGADIPPATLYLDFGKPVFSPDLAPPFLVGVMHCYWTQKPGYSLDEAQLRRILYDYAYVRPTWKEDKRGRAQKALEHEDTWQQDLIIGLGRKLGPFWYPDQP